MTAHPDDGSVVAVQPRRHCGVPGLLGYRGALRLLRQLIGNQGRSGRIDTSRRGVDTAMILGLESATALLRTRSRALCHTGDTPMHDYRRLAAELTDLLGLEQPPLAIAFSDAPPAGIEPHRGQMPPPTGDGRTGRVPAGCVFWIQAEDRSFSTVAEDHGNCSVGSVTHGFKTLDEVAGNQDVATLVECQWVSPEVFPRIPVVRKRHAYVSYGPLHDTTIDPDVVFLRLNAKQAMVLSDALPGLRFEGKPQCHIIAIAKEQAQPAVSVGCMLSRVRTGMPATQMSCAIPGAQLQDVVNRLAGAVTADKAVAAYASEDSRRFAC